MSSYTFQGAPRIWTPRDEEENRAIFSSQREPTDITMPNEFKPVYLANAEFEVEKWSIKKLTRLLRLYAVHRCLWDVRDPDNRNRKLRRAALVDITAAMAGGVTRTQVVQKINVLRATYRYEKRRIKRRMRRGMGAKTKLKWFALADAFLRNVPRTEKFKRDEQADSDSDLEDNVVFTIDPESLMPLDEDEEEGQERVHAYWQKGNRGDDEFSSSSSQASSFRDIIFSPTQECERNHQDLFMEPAPLSPKKEIIDEPPTLEIKAEFKLQVKQPWTSQESLQFIQLLKDQPDLWNNSLNPTAEQQQHALKIIATAMNLPQQRIEKRLHTFRHTYENEKLKISKNVNYQSNLIWWRDAENFMESQNIPPTDEHFVDANEAPPPTPLILQHNHFKKELKDDDDDFELQNAYTPINPISSVAPLSQMPAAMEEALETLFNETTEEAEYASENNDDINIAAEKPNSPATKVIWNGLEDDLLEGKWSLKNSVKFLRLYGAHRCLWDLKDSDYRSRELRNAAIADIAAAMGHNLTVDYVAKKIKIFRITYMQHRKRMLAAIQQGREPEIQLRWFPLADSFLRPHIGLRSIKEHEREMPQFDLQYVYAKLNLIDPALLTDFRGKGTQNTIEIGAEAALEDLPPATSLKCEETQKRADRTDTLME